MSKLRFDVGPIRISTPATLTAVRSGGDLHVPHPQLAFPREAQQGSEGRRVPALPHPHLGAGATYVLEYLV